MCELTSSSKILDACLGGHMTASSIMLHIQVNLINVLMYMYY